MSYSAEQIGPKAGQKKWITSARTTAKIQKQNQHRRQRQKMRASLDYVPRYNRYEGGWIV